MIVIISLSHWEFESLSTEKDIYDRAVDSGWLSVSKNVFHHANVIFIVCGYTRDLGL